MTVKSLQGRIIVLASLFHMLVFIAFYNDILGVFQGLANKCPHYVDLDTFCNDYILSEAAHFINADIRLDVVSLYFVSYMIVACSITNIPIIFIYYWIGRSWIGRDSGKGLREYYIKAYNSINPPIESRIFAFFALFAVFLLSAYFLYIDIGKFCGVIYNSMSGNYERLLGDKFIGLLYLIFETDLVFALIEWMIYLRFTWHHLYDVVHDSYNGGDCV